MKYRILIRSISANVSSLNWFTGSAGNDPWETGDETEALQKYQELLNTNPSCNLTLTQIIPVNISVSV
jgi:hypothetical protein